MTTNVGNSPAETETSFMNVHTSNEIPAPLPPARVVLTVSQFAKRHPAFTAASLRQLIFAAAPRMTSRGPIKGNGLEEAGAILRVGRKILIDETRFFNWLDATNAIQGRRQA
jgi:hypothetical protein